MLWLPVVAAVCLVAGVWTGYFLSRQDPTIPSRQKLDRIFGIIENNYVDEVAFDSLVEKTIPDLLQNLDPHSAYFSARQRAAANRDLESSFYGIGISFQMMNDTLVVLEVINGGAAEGAGVMPGDKIIAVDGETIAGNGTKTDDVFHRLRGPKGTPVTITVKRGASAQPLNFDLVRDEVPVSPIDASYMINDTIGYIRLGKFADNTYPEFMSVMAQLQYDGAKAYILDLRGNTGGYMNPAVLMANEFLAPNQLIVMTKGRIPSQDNILFSDGSGAYASRPLVVLVDEFTASSSEIMAGAMQDNDRALIIGRRTFGKGLVQRSFELPDSSEFRLTVQRYYTPSGRCIQKTYTPGHNYEYEAEVYERYSKGEIFSADSIPVDSTNIFYTMSGRPVYGSGGIIPDIFIPSDTTGITNYYIKVANAGLLRNFAYEYADLNRESLTESRDLAEMLTKLPSDGILLQSFVNYASQKGVAPRWYYINISAPLIVNQLKALIARDILGMDGYFEVVNTSDPVVIEAINRLESGAINDLLIKNSNKSNE